MKTTVNTYETINLLRATAGVTIGDYKYNLDNEVIEGYDYETTENLSKNKFIPVVRIECNDGWVEATNYKNTLDNLF